MRQIGYLQGLYAYLYLLNFLIIYLFSSCVAVHLLSYWSLLSKSMCICISNHPALHQLSLIRQSVTQDEVSECYDLL